MLDRYGHQRVGEVYYAKDQRAISYKAHAMAEKYELYGSQTGKIVSLLSNYSKMIDFIDGQIGKYLNIYKEYGLDDKTAKEMLFNDTGLLTKDANYIKQLLAILNMVGLDEDALFSKHTLSQKNFDLQELYAVVKTLQSMNYPFEDDGLHLILTNIGKHDLAGLKRKYEYSAKTAFALRITYGNDLKKRYGKKEL